MDIIYLTILGSLLFLVIFVVLLLPVEQNPRKRRFVMIKI
jgi:hypothetical protein